MFPSIDVVGCKIIFLNVTLLVFTLYIPPNISLEDYSQFFDAFEALNCFSLNCKILILGDFNAPLFYTNINDFKSRAVGAFLDYINGTQYNHIVNQQNRLLDLVLANFTCSVNRDVCPFTKEDSIYHPALHICLQLNFIDSKFLVSDECTKYNFKHANYPLLYTMLQQAEWGVIENCESINEASDIFYATLKTIFDTCIPLYKKSSNNSSRQYPPWFNREIITNIRLKSSAHKNFKKHKTDNYLETFRYLRSLIKVQIKTSYAAYIQDMERNISTDPNKFWGFINNKTGRSRIPGLMSFNDSVYDTPQTIVDGFSNFFSSVYLDSQSNFSDTDSLQLSNLNIFINSISENEIVSASKKLKNKMTAGVDNVPSFIIKDCINALVKPLHYLFNLILSTSTYPDIWKTAKICPVHKSGDRASIDNYRPISILCNFGKLFEIIVYQIIYNSVRSSITSSQHGFMSGRSTVTNLICITQYVSNILDKAGQVDVVYTDIKKAFDQIDHCGLLSKLKSIGFSSPLLKLIESYLLNRHQFVEYGGIKSPTYVSTSGVPQGSNLGPLLFLIFINDISKIIPVHHSLFADDLKIYIEIKSINDCDILQNALNAVHVWCQDNNLQLNLSKCKVMSFHRKHTPFVFNYSLENSKLERCETFKDLGVVFDPGLSFSKHIADAVSSARRLLGYFIRNWKDFSNVSTMKLLYVTYIRSKMEYASVVWSPGYQNSIKHIESVQRKCLKYLFFKCYGYYPQIGFDHSLLLETFNFLSLSNRRDCAALTLVCKLFANKIDCDYLLSQFSFFVPRLQSRHSQSTFFYKTPRTNLLIKSPVYNMSQLYNRISNRCDIHFDTLHFIISTFKGIISE